MEAAELDQEQPGRLEPSAKACRSTRSEGNETLKSPAQPSVEEDFIRSCVSRDEVSGGLRIRIAAGGGRRSERARCALLPGGEVYTHARRLGSRDVVHVDVSGLSLTGKPCKALCRWLMRRPCPQQAVLGGSLLGPGVAKAPISCQMQRLPALTQQHILCYACPQLLLEFTGCSLTDEDVAALRGLVWCRLKLQYNFITCSGAIELIRSAAISLVPDVQPCYVLDLRGNPIQSRTAFEEEAQRCIQRVELTGSMRARTRASVVVGLSPAWVMDLSQWALHIARPAANLAHELTRGDPSFWQCPCCRGKFIDMRATQDGGFVELLTGHFIGLAHWRNIRRIAFNDEESVSVFSISDRMYYFNLLSGAQGWTRDHCNV